LRSPHLAGSFRGVPMGAPDDSEHRLTLKPVGRQHCRFLLASKFRLLARTAQAMRASLLASAIARTLWCRALLCCLDPGLQPMAFPALRPDQHNPRRLNEEDAQITIAAFGYLAEDRTAAGGDLFGHKPQPCGEVATFGEHITGSNCSHHRTRYDWADPRHAHQPFATGIMARQRLEFSRQPFDPLVQSAPLSGQVLNRVHHAWRENIVGRGEDARQFDAQEAQSLTDGAIPRSNMKARI
jgi:hypothetical protein